MKKILFFLSVAFLILFMGYAQQSITTPNTSNNGSGAVTVDIIAGSQPVTITGFATPFTTAGATVVHLYYRQGSACGNISSSAGWTLIGQQAVTITSTGNGNNTYVEFPTPVTIPAGSMYGFYFAAPNAPGGGVRYTTGGSTCGATTIVSNGDLSLKGGHGITSVTAPFVGAANQERNFAGTIYYTTASCASPTNLVVNYAKYCASATLTWKTPIGKGKSDMVPKMPEGEVKTTPREKNEEAYNKIMANRLKAKEARAEMKSASAPVTQIEIPNPNGRGPNTVAYVFDEYYWEAATMPLDNPANLGHLGYSYNSYCPMGGDWIDDEWYCVDICYSELYKINTTTGDFSYIAYINISAPVGLGYNPADGNTYVIDLWSNIYQVNISTGATNYKTTAYNIPWGGPMAFTNDGRCIVLDWEGAYFYEVNINTGAAIPLMAHGLYIASYDQDIAIDRETNTIYWTYCDENQMTGLYHVDLDAGTKTLISNFGYYANKTAFAIPAPTVQYDYNIYCNGDLIAGPVSANSYTTSALDLTLEAHTWSVARICEDGEESEWISVTKEACEECPKPTDLVVDYSEDCETAKLTWSVPVQGKGKSIGAPERPEGERESIRGERENIRGDRNAEINPVMKEKISKMIANAQTRREAREMPPVELNTRSGDRMAYGFDFWNWAFVTFPLDNIANMNVLNYASYAIMPTGADWINDEWYFVSFRNYNTWELDYNLYKASTETGAYSTAGTHNVYQPVGMAYNAADGCIYITNYIDENYAELYKYNMSTGVTTYINTISGAVMNGGPMVFTNDGRCIMLDFNYGDIVELNINTGSTTLLISTGLYLYTNFQDMAIDRATNTIYWTSFDYYYNSTYYSINPDNNTLTYLGYISGQVAALAISPPPAQYNIYCNGEFVAGPISGTSYTTKTQNLLVENIWSVIAVCENGSESGALTVTKEACECATPLSLDVEYTPNCSGAQLTWEMPEVDNSCEVKVNIIDAHWGDGYSWMLYDDATYAILLEGGLQSSTGSYVTEGTFTATLTGSATFYLWQHTYTDNRVTLSIEVDGVEVHYLNVPQNGMYSGYYNMASVLCVKDGCATDVIVSHYRYGDSFSWRLEDDATGTTLLGGGSQSGMGSIQTGTFSTQLPGDATFYIWQHGSYDDNEISLKIMVKGEEVYALTVMGIPYGYSQSAPIPCSIISDLFNIYRDGELIADNITELSYLDTDFYPYMPHTWAVTKNCAAGETNAVEVAKASCGTLSVISLTPEDGAIAVPVNAEVAVFFSAMNIVANDLSGITINGIATTATLTDNKLVIHHSDFTHNVLYTVFVPANTILGYAQDITWSFIDLKYTITPTAIGNGTLSPGEPVLVAHGTNQTFNIMPNTGYHIVSILIDGVAIDYEVDPEATVPYSYTFENVTTDHTITVTFAINCYTINPDNIAGKFSTITMTPANCVPYGEDVTFYFTTDCANITQVLINDVPQGIMSSYTINSVSGPLPKIEVKTIIHQFTITATPQQEIDPMGYITPAGTYSVECRDNISFEIIPADGYRIAKLYVDGVSVPIPASKIYTFTNVSANHTIHVEFEISPFFIIQFGPHETQEPEKGGFVYPEYKPSAIYYVFVDSGTLVYPFIIQAKDGFEIDQLFVDGHVATFTTQTSNQKGTYVFTNVINHHIIYATFKPIMYTIMATSDMNGSINPSGAWQVAEGSDQTFQAFPNFGYELSVIKVDGNVNQQASEDGIYTFVNVQANHTISAEFTKVKYLITTTAGANGIITPANPLVAHGNSQTFTIIPDEGYKITEVLVDGTPNLSALQTGSFTFTNVTQPHTISATFSKMGFTITTTGTAGGTITPEEAVPVAEVEYGEHSVIYVFFADEGYRIQSVLVDGVNDPIAVQEGMYRFLNVTANHTLHVIFVPDNFTITATASTGGTITPAGLVTVVGHTNQKFTFEANAGFELVRVMVNGMENEEAVANNQYTFYGVTSNQTIAAHFERLLYTVTLPDEEGATAIPTNGSTTTVPFGGKFTFVVELADSHSQSNITVRANNIILNSVGGVYTINNIMMDQTITLTGVAVNMYRIVARANAGGTISPVGTFMVAHGNEMTFELKPNDKFEVRELVVNGVAVEWKEDLTYTHTATADATIEVSFKPATVGIDENKPVINVFSYSNVVTIVNEKLVPVKIVEIMDMYGRVVWRGQANDAKTEITLHVATGIYNVRVVTETNISITKVCIN